MSSSSNETINHSSASIGKTDEEASNKRLKNWKNKYEKSGENDDDEQRQQTNPCNIKTCTAHCASIAYLFLCFSTSKNDRSRSEVEEVQKEPKCMLHEQQINQMNHIESGIFVFHFAFYFTTRARVIVCILA